ncbi:MAG: hypothetical protein ACRC8Y_25405, partial [Chroococcales cyanobacterium]
MNHSLHYLPLAALADRIAEPDFLTQIAGTPLWDEAPVRITSDWQPPATSQLAVASRHGCALSWL